MMSSYDAEMKSMLECGAASYNINFSHLNLTEGLFFLFSDVTAISCRTSELEVLPTAR